MIFADKLIELRKKNGMTQEELAEKMNVSRQSVSKWEGAQSVPDLDKILRLSQLFGVSTDYLLKDDMDAPEFVQTHDDTPGLRQVTMEEADAFLSAKEASAAPIALGVGLCITSPVVLLMLCAFSETWGVPSENLAGGLGTIVLLILVSAAVALFLSAGAKTSSFEWLEKEAFETAYGVDGMVRERQKKLRPLYLRRLCVGIGLCILCPAPLLMAAALTEHEVAVMGCTCVLLGMVALGVGCIIRACVPWDALQQLLQEGDYTPEKKKHSPILTAVGTVYWLVVTAVFLFLGFFHGDWGRFALIWPVAGVLFGAVMAVCGLLLRNKD